ncbi:transglycosylase SLT domain-containing protein, partial [Peptostreptococcus porci]
YYLKKLESQFDGNLTLMIAAYNGGSGNVRKWLKNPQYSSDGVTLENIPFKETSGYTKKVLKNYELYKKIYQ